VDPSDQEEQSPGPESRQLRLIPAERLPQNHNAAEMVLCVTSTELIPAFPGFADKIV
jgi:hypothetical protein